jgi:hypothetical protein
MSDARNLDRWRTFWLVPPAVLWFRTSRTGVSRHAGLLSPVIPDWAVAGFQLAGRVTYPFADHRCGGRESVLSVKSPAPMASASPGCMSCSPATAAGGETVFQPRSRRPRSNPNATAAEVLDLIVELREKLTATGLDAGPDTIVWHVAHHHDITISRATVARHLTRTGLVIPEPTKRPKSSF